MEAFLPESVQLILLGVLAAGLTLITLANAYPQVSWLEPFRLPQLNERQKARLRRSNRVTTGAQLILVGIALPLVYILSRVMLFHDIRTGSLAVACAGSLLCIVLGIWIIVRAR